MREALEREGAPADILQCLTKVNIPMSQALMARADLIIATGGQPMVRAAYSSGTPAYGVGAGNSTMIIDETANIEEAARNTRLSKTSDFGSGCSADGNLIIEASIFDRMVKQLQLEGGYLANEQEKAALKRAMWDAEGHRTPMTSSLGCGTWGGNIVSENVHLKHYLNTTWVSVPIKEDRPSDEELFGPFYDPELEAEVESITT